MLPVFDPSRLVQIQQDYFERVREVFTAPPSKPAVRPAADKRFAGAGWQEGINALNASLYLLNADTLMKMVDAVQGLASIRRGAASGSFFLSAGRAARSDRAGSGHACSGRSAPRRAAD